MENKIEIINNCNESKDKNESTLNNVDNANTKYTIKSRSKNIEWKRKTYHFSRNKFDNDTLTPNFKILTSEYTLKTMKASHSCYNSVNDANKQKITQIQTKNKSEWRSKKDAITKNKVDNNTIEHDSCLYKIAISKPKIYIYIYIYNTTWL